MVELRENEIQILEALNKSNGKASVDDLISNLKLTDSAIMRSALVLQEQNLISIHAEFKTQLKLTNEGKIHANKGLPERRLINAVLDLGGKATLNQASQKANLEQKFVMIALGWTQKKKWALFDSKKNQLTVNTPPPDGQDEKLLGQIAKNESSEINQSLNFSSAIDTLKKRKAITIEEKTVRFLELTKEGLKTLKHGSYKKIATQKEVTQLTPELIITGKWRQVKLQRYNIHAPVANTWPGKKHPYLLFLDEVRTKLVNLGFEEMTGTNVETSFFNFDALYTPQDHPARELDGIYKLKDPQYGNLNDYSKFVENVKKTHETGGETLSTGWGYLYSPQKACRLILRGHGTCLSARTLTNEKIKIPSKHFSIARVYRPELVDKTHLAEFNQVEGIVINKNLSLKDLLGVLSTFAKEIAGADKIRFKPDYFPFTEPSVELSAYKKGYGWVELGGSGIFRPEVTTPLGIKVPVIAWGLGVDRLYMMRAGIDDIRDIFSSNLEWLRKKEIA